MNDDYYASIKRLVSITNKAG